jgi:hypothetical protein
MSIFRKGSVICIVEKQDNENRDVFIDRGNFIVSQKPHNKKTYDEAVVYSKVYANEKYLHSEYDSDVKGRLDAMKKNCVVNIDQKN